MTTHEFTKLITSMYGRIKQTLENQAHEITEYTRSPNKTNSSLETHKRGGTLGLDTVAP